MKCKIGALVTVLALTAAGCATPSSSTTDSLASSRRSHLSNADTSRSTAISHSTARPVTDGDSTTTQSSEVSEQEESDESTNVDSAESSQIQPVSLDQPDVPPSPKGSDEKGSDEDAKVGANLVSPNELPIDVVTVLRLVNNNSPAIGISQARLAEARARAQAANYLWFPNVNAGVAFNRYDGQTQNQRGEIFAVSRSNLFAQGGASLSLDLAEAIYKPLIEQQVAAAASQQLNSISLTAQLDSVLAYLDLVQTHGLLEINAQVLEKGEAMLVAAQNAQKAKLDRSPGDVNRVKTEILMRRQDRVDLIGRSNVASTRLGKLLLLRSTVRLVPDKSEIVPITLVSTDPSSYDELVVTAVQNRPDLAANRELLAAAWSRVRKARYGPLFPKVLATEQGGTFGGGKNSTIGEYEGRNVVTGMVYWELKNLGFGNLMEIIEREAGSEQAHFQLIETQARVAAEVVEAAQLTDAKRQSMEVAEQAVEEANELYRISQEGTFNVIDPKNLFDALRPLQALQFVQQTRQNYLAAIIDYNRAQYRLYTVIGCPLGNLEQQVID